MNRTSKQVTLQAETRDATGKGAARRLRRDGYVPAVVYGHGDDSRNVKVRVEELESLLGRISADNTLIDLEVEADDSQRVLIREVQRHPVRPDILHVDFFHIREDEKIRVEVPLRLTGEAAGVEEGGILQQNKHEVAIECLPGDIPEVFVLDVSGLEVGDSLHVRDLETGGIMVLEDPDLTLCTVVPPTIVEVEEPEEELAILEELEPELVGREREEAEPEEAEGAEEAEEPEAG